MERRTGWALLLMVTFGLLWQASALAEVRPHLNERAQAVLYYLEGRSGEQVLLGYNVYPHTPDVFEQTGKRAAIIGRDIRWLDDYEEVIDEVNERGCLLTLHWHWHFAGDSAWRGRRKEPVAFEALLQEGTPQNRQLLKELDWAAARLKHFQEAGIPVLWRPLHEIDGGWFWWTDRETPEHTARLWRLMFERFTEYHKLSNLIWVYSAGVGLQREVEYRKRFYPGSEYVDLSGIDIYGVDFKTADPKYWTYYRMMEEVSPGKALVLGECDALPDPALMASGELPAWVYAMPWWGTPSEKRDVAWARYATQHPFMGTLDELPAFHYDGLAPVVGLLGPEDDGSARYEKGDTVEIDVQATDRDGEIRKVEFWAGGELIGEREADALFTFVWSDAPVGFHEIRAQAFDDEGLSSWSNSVRVLVGQEDLAMNQPVFVSSGEDASQAVDGSFHTSWKAEASDPQWIFVDLQERKAINEVALIWGFRSNGKDFELEIASRNPDREASWIMVHRRNDRPYQSWKAMDRIFLNDRKARYVRLKILNRAGEWSGEGTRVAALMVFGE